jgi:type I restriction enzyme S subunit
MGAERTVSQLLNFTRDGEWGRGEPTPGFVPMQVIRGTDFERVRFGDLSTLPIRYIREDIAGRKAIKANDVLIETAGGTKDQPTGRTVLIKGSIIAKAKFPLICASFARFLRPDLSAVDPGYLFWKLQAEYHSGALLPFHIQHTGVARFQYTQFATNHPLLFPNDLDGQRINAEVLSALDDKIELNRQMNETLEGMAQAIFRDWFVDFGPVRRKAAGETDPVAIMGGLTPDPARAAQLAALFPAVFGNDDLPAGWSRRTIESIMNLAYGKSLPKTVREDGPFPVYGSGGIAGCHSTALVSGPGIIVGRKGTVGSLYWEPGDFFAIDTVFYVVPKAGVPLGFAWHLLQTLGLEGMNTDAAVPGLNRDNAYRLEFAFGGVPLLDAFERFVGPLRARQDASNAETQTLAETRDYLLPRLMSGEVRVVPPADMSGH